MGTHVKESHRFPASRFKPQGYLWRCDCGSIFSLDRDTNHFDYATKRERISGKRSWVDVTDLIANKKPSDEVAFLRQELERVNRGFQDYKSSRVRSEMSMDGWRESVAKALSDHDVRLKAAETPKGKKK